MGSCDGTGVLRPRFRWRCREQAFEGGAIRALPAGERAPVKRRRVPGIVPSSRL